METIADKVGSSFFYVKINCSQEKKKNFVAQLKLVADLQNQVVLPAQFFSISCLPLRRNCSLGIENVKMCVL